MQLKLGPETYIWGLVNPLYRGSIKAEDGKDVLLLLNQERPGPCSIDYSSLPVWAKKQVDLSIAHKRIVDCTQISELEEKILSAQGPVEINNEASKDDTIELPVEPPKKKHWKTLEKEKRLEEEKNGGQTNSDISNPI